MQGHPLFFEISHGMNRTPNLVVGDFDSLPVPPVSSAGTAVLSQDKDDTDMVAALREGVPSSISAQTGTLVIIYLKNTQEVTI